MIRTVVERAVCGDEMVSDSTRLDSKQCTPLKLKISWDRLVESNQCPITRREGPNRAKQTATRTCLCESGVVAIATLQMTAGLARLTNV